MSIPKISAMTFDGKDWSGWSNAKGRSSLTSLEDAVFKVKNDPELAHRIIDADNLKIWISDPAFTEIAIQSAKSNFGVDITDVIIGLP